MQAFTSYAPLAPELRIIQIDISFLGKCDVIQRTLVHAACLEFHGTLFDGCSSVRSNGADGAGRGG